MCGIYGFVTKKACPSSEVLRGLKILEYRGYDSWGIAIKVNRNKKTENKLEVEKHVGKIQNSSHKSLIINHKSLLALGHTRWATHGGVTVKNAHPHLDCTQTLALVHNGIFENYQEIKKKLIKKGHFFESETDSEVIIHLIEENLKRTAQLQTPERSRNANQKTFGRSDDGQGFATAVRDAFDQIRGLNAIVVANAKSKEIIACKNGSPLIIGIAENGYYISSDISALPVETKKISVLPDNFFAILGENFKLISIKTGLEAKPHIESVHIDKNLNSKGKFKHFLLKEIYEQPQIIKNIPINSNKDIKKLAKNINQAKGTFFLGCGSASYAAMAGVYLFSKIAKHHVNFAAGSEFKYIQDFINKKSLIVPISQSGETIDVVEPVQIAKEKGAKIAPIINAPNSTLARIGSFTLPLNSGPEKAVVGTKSFTTMVGLLLLASFNLAGKYSEGEKLLAKSAKDIKTLLAPHSIRNIQKLAKKISKKEHVFTIGRGISYVAAIEAALKLKETSLIHAEGFAGGELKHGVIALIEKGTPCIVFAPNDETFDDIVSNAQEIKSRGGYIIGIGPKNTPVFDEFIKTGDCKEATIISQIVVMQLLAYFAALERGIEDPDKPRNLAKSVTVK